MAGHSRRQAHRCLESEEGVDRGCGKGGRRGESSCMLGPGVATLGTGLLAKGEICAERSRGVGTLLMGTDSQQTCVGGTGSVFISQKRK